MPTCFHIVLVFCSFYIWNSVRVSEDRALCCRSGNHGMNEDISVWDCYTQVPGCPQCQPWRATYLYWAWIPWWWDGAIIRDRNWTESTIYKLIHLRSCISIYNTILINSLRTLWKYCILDQLSNVRNPSLLKILSKFNKKCTYLQLLPQAGKK